MTAEHLRVLLDSPSCTSLLGEAASQLAQGNIPEEVVSVIRLGRMTVLSKTEGIVIGDVFRRVVARDHPNIVSTMTSEDRKPQFCPLMALVLMTLSPEMPCSEGGRQG